MSILKGAGIGAILGGPMGAQIGGLAGGMSKDGGPRPQQEGLTPEAENLIKKQQELASMTPEQIAQQQVEGTKSASNLLDTGSEEKNIAMGGSQPAYVQEALKRRSGKAFDNLGIKMKNQAKMSADSRLAKQQDLAFQSQMGKQQIANDSYNRDLQDQQNRRAARNAIIGSITGGAGAALGAMAGGAKGASAGHKVGSSMAGSSEMNTGRIG